MTTEPISELDRAIDRRDLDAVRVLLLEGADFVVKEDSLNEALLKVCDVGHPELIRRCVDAGADVNTWKYVIHGYFDLFPPTPLGRLCSVGLKDCFKTGGKNLLAGSERQARAGAREPYLVESARYLIDKGARVNELNPGGVSIVSTTPLIQACRAGYTALVQLLLRSGANVNNVDWFGRTALMAAAESGRLDLMTILLDHGANIHLDDSGGETALFIACASARLEAVQFLHDRGASLGPIHNKTALMSTRDLKLATFLLDHGVDVNFTDQWGHTALIDAAHRGDLKLIKLLLARAANVNAVGVQGTALSLASIRGHMEVVRLLLENGANPNLTSSENNSALAGAARKSNEELMVLLLKSGADVDIVDGYRETAIKVAAIEADLAAAKLLLDHGALPTWPDGHWLPFSSNTQEDRLEVARFLLNRGLNPDIPDELGQTELMMFCRTGHVEFVKLLLEFGADIHFRDHEGRTALLNAALSGKGDVVALLLGKGADVNAPDNNGRTALIEAASCGSLHVARMLVEKGADPYDWDSDWITPVLAAASSGNVEVVQLLVDYGANIDDRDILGDTVLVKASTFGNYNMVKWLLDLGMNPNVGNDHGITALMSIRAATHKCFQNEPVDQECTCCAGDRCGAQTDQDPVTTLIDLLISRGARMDVRDDKGMTSIMHFAWAGNTTAVAELIRRGASIHERDKKGKTALMWAASSGVAEVTELLLDHGADYNEADNDGWTALHHAATSGTFVPDSAEVLLRAGIKIDVTEKDGKTPLLIAAGSKMHRHLDATSFFIWHGADINHRDRFGRTALMYAAMHARLDDTDVLLYSGANPFLVDDDGFTALMLAESHGAQSTTRYLRAGHLSNKQPAE